jgi:hypothetical protein
MNKDLEKLQKLTPIMNNKFLINKSHSQAHSTLLFWFTLLIIHLLFKMILFCNKITKIAIKLITRPINFFKIKIIKLSTMKITT